MGLTLYWLHCGGCGGDTWSLFNVATPNIKELFETLQIEILWHPSISTMNEMDHKQLLADLKKDRQKLDLLCIEGAIIRGPRGTGLYDMASDQPKKDLVATLARKARYVLAVGTCASFGGFGADEETEATGMQYCKWEKGGFMGTSFLTQSGLPVINLPGCPCHPDILTGTLSILASGGTLDLTEHQTPVEWYNLMVHQGCTRNEYHEYRVEDKGFGEKGCMFFHMGCHGPLAHGPCNKLLWNNRSSKTRAGVPCFGCTRPDFPQTYPFFKTRNIEGIPLELPEGINRAHYMAYKGMAAAAAPQRLKTRKTGI